MLGSANVVAFAPTRDPRKARAFYEKTLGLEFVSEDPFAVVFNANGVSLRVADVSTVKGFKPAPFTILGWEVPSADKAGKELTKKRGSFERVPGMDQDELGILSSPSGARVARVQNPHGDNPSIH